MIIIILILNMTTVSNKRKLTIDFNDLIDVIYDKIDSKQLQEFLEELIDSNKTDKLNIIISNLSQILPSIGSTMEEFEDNVRNGTIVHIINDMTNSFNNKLTEGDIEKEISDKIKKVTNTIDTVIVSKKRKI